MHGLRPFSSLWTSDPMMPRVAGRQIHRCNAPADNPEQYYHFHSFVAFILHSQRKMSSSRKSEEENTSPSDEALEEVNNHIKEAFEILKRETKKARMKKEALDETAKKLEHVHFSTMLKLNVRGHLFFDDIAVDEERFGISDAPNTKTFSQLATLLREHF